jgi:hypothetical protein
MIPYQVDPSLHPAEPAPPQLDDGFSPPAQQQAEAEPKLPARGASLVEPVDPALWAKSDF